METLSSSLFQQAKQLIPGGVNSPVRACAAVGAEPLFISAGAGSKIQTVDGTTYIDFVQSWGPMLLGHAYPDVSKALHKAVDHGTSFGAPCPDEITLAKAVNEAMPSMEMIRMVNSGTEATMSAIRLARGYTNRKKIIKFDGGYHGHADSFLANAGSGVATFSIPGTPGVPDAVVADMLVVPYNNLDAVSATFEANPNEIAAIIVEPCAGNMGLILPKDGFLEGLRTICTNNKALLIFDEVITGFRVSFGGAQKRFGVTPDLTTIGKIIGGGLPVGAYGGKKSIMERIAPSGDIYQAGTLSGNPLAMAAGIATVEAIKSKDYDKLELHVELLCKKLEQIFEEKNIPVKINRIASMFSIFFTSEPVTDFASAKKSDTERYSRFYNHMRDKGIYLAPSAFEVAMVSFAHSDEDFTAMLCAVESFTG